MWAQFSPKYFEFLLTSGIWSTWVLLGGGLDTQGLWCNDSMCEYIGGKDCHSQNTYCHT